MKKNMKQCLMWMRWKMPEKWCTFFPPSQFLFVNNFFCLSSNLFLEIQSTSIELHQLLSIITNYFYYIYRCQSNQKNKSKKFFENQKNNNCRLKLSLFYPNILSIVIYVTTYYNILTNWNKKIEISFQHKTFLAYYCCRYNF